ncbi:hypothetical protein HDU67_004117 [Dinochytrium kinnereticum]|nr:hypothetical protein HDU67_004117 [Dinochytrium kinnereticum]
MVAMKSPQGCDNTYTNKGWNRISKVPLHLLNAMELQMLISLRFDMWVSEQGFSVWLQFVESAIAQHMGQSAGGVVRPLYPKRSSSLSVSTKTSTETPAATAVPTVAPVKSYPSPASASSSTMPDISYEAADHKITSSPATNAMEVSVPTHREATHSTPMQQYLHHKLRIQGHHNFSGHQTDSASFDAGNRRQLPHHYHPSPPNSNYGSPSVDTLAVPVIPAQFYALNHRETLLKTSNDFTASADFPDEISQRRLASVDISNTRTVKRSRAGPPNEIAIETADERFMDSTIRIWDFRKHKTPMMTLDPRTAPQALLSNATAQTIHLQKSNKRTRGEKMKQPSEPLSSSVRSAPVNGLSFIPGTRRLVSAGHDCQLRLWDTLTGAHLPSNSCLRFSIAKFRSRYRRDSLIAAVPCDDERIRLYDLTTGNAINDLICHWGRVSCVAARLCAQVFAGEALPQRPINPQKRKPQHPTESEKGPASSSAQAAYQPNFYSTAESARVVEEDDFGNEPVWAGTKTKEFLIKIINVRTDWKAEGSLDTKAGDELEAYCLFSAQKELSSSAEFTAKLFPLEFPLDSEGGVDGDLDEMLMKLSVDDREIRDCAILRAARILADRVVTEKSQPRRLSLTENIFGSKKKGIYERAEVLQSIESGVLSYISSEVKPAERSYRGLKPTNEDRVISIPDASLLFASPESEKYEKIGFFGVYDGHGGETCADYVRAYLHINVLRHEKFFEDIPLALKEGFLRTNENFRRCLTRESENSNAGSTATVGIIKGNVLYLAWAGDSPSFLLTDSGISSFLLKPPHSASEASERRRVEALGGVFLKDNDSYRLNGSLSVTRSFGDFRISCMTAEPDIISVPLNSSSETPTDAVADDKRSDKNHSAGAAGPYRYFVISSDGLTDVMSPEDVWKAIRVKEDPTLGDVLGTLGFDQADQGGGSDDEDNENDDSNPSVGGVDGEGGTNKKIPGYPDLATRIITTPVPIGTCEHITQAAVDFKNSMDNVSMVLVKFPPDLQDTKPSVGKELVDANIGLQEPRRSVESGGKGDAYVGSNGNHCLEPSAPRRSSSGASSLFPSETTSSIQHGTDASVAEVDAVSAGSYLDPLARSPRLRRVHQPRVPDNPSNWNTPAHVEIPVFMPRPLAISAHSVEERLRLFEISNASGRIDTDSVGLAAGNGQALEECPRGYRLVEHLEKWANSSPSQQELCIIEGAGSPGNTVDSAIGSSYENMSPFHASDSGPLNCWDNNEASRQVTLKRITTPTVFVQVPFDDQEQVRAPEPKKTESIAAIDSDVNSRGKQRRARPVTWSAGSGHVDYLQSRQLSQSELSDSDVPSLTLNKRGFASSAPTLNSSPHSPSCSRSRSRSDQRSASLPTPIIVSTNFGSMVIGAGSEEEDDEEGVEGSAGGDHSDDKGRSCERDSYDGRSDDSVSEFGGMLRREPSPVGSFNVGSRSEVPTRPLSPCSDASSKVSLGRMQTRLTESPLPKEMDLFFRELEDMLDDANRHSPSASSCSTTASTPCLSSTSQNPLVRQVEQQSSFIPRAWSLPHGELHRRYHSPWLNPNQPPSPAMSVGRSREASASFKSGSRDFLKVYPSDGSDRNETCPWESLESITSKDIHEDNKGVSRSLPSLAARRDGGGSNGQLSERGLPSRENSRSKDKRSTSSSLDKLNLLAGLSCPRSSTVPYGLNVEHQANEADIKTAKVPYEKAGPDSAYSSAGSELAIEKRHFEDSSQPETESEFAEVAVEGLEPLKREGSLKTAWKSMRNSIFRV